MDMGYIDEGVDRGRGFEVVAAMERDGWGDEEEERGAKGERGNWHEERGGGIEELGEKELKAIMMGGNKKMSRAPRKYAWEVEDLKRQEELIEIEEEKSGWTGQGVEEGHGTQGPQKLDSRLVWEQLRNQSEYEARVRYGKLGNKYKRNEEKERGQVRKVEGHVHRWKGAEDGISAVCVRRAEA